MIYEVDFGTSEIDEFYAEVLVGLLKYSDANVIGLFLVFIIIASHFLFFCRFFLLLNDLDR